MDRARLAGGFLTLGLWLFALSPTLDAHGVSTVPQDAEGADLSLTPVAAWPDRCPAPRLALLVDDDEPLRLMAEVSPMIAAALADTRTSAGGFLPQSLHNVEAALSQRLSTEAVRAGLRGEDAYGVPVPPGKTWLVLGGPGGPWAPEDRRTLVYRYGLYLEDTTGHRMLAEPRLDVEFGWLRREALGAEEPLVWIDIYRVRSWRQVAEDFP